MNKNRLIFTFFTFIFSLLFVNCDYENTDTGGAANYQRFNWDIQGTWKTNDTESRYTGTLVIGYNRITITGYGETQTPANIWNVLKTRLKAEGNQLATNCSQLNKTHFTFITIPHNTKFSRPVDVGF